MYGNEEEDGRTGWWGLGKHFLVDDDQDQQDENGYDGAGYETLLVHPKIHGNLR